MACQEPILTTKILTCLGLFLVATSFCHGKGLTKLKALDKSMGNSNLGHVEIEGLEQHHGKLLIGQNTAETKITKNPPEVDTDYQADMGWEQSKQHKGQVQGFSEQKQDTSTVERLLQMEPKVECTRDSMKLQVQDAVSNPGSLLFVDRGSRLSPLPLSKLPSSCGYSFQATRRDLVLVAPYDGCFVALEEDTYVLPLRWWGLPVKMSCPLMRQPSSNPPMVFCHAEGMTVKTDWTMSAASIKVKLSGHWVPLLTTSWTCGFTVVVQPEGMTINVRYTPCIQETGGMYTLELAGDGETKLSCPSLTSEFEPTKGSVKNPNPQTDAPGKGMQSPTQSQNIAENQAIDHPQLPHFPTYPKFFYPVNPESTLTEKPYSPPVTDTNVGQQQPIAPPANPSVTPEGQVQQSFYQYLYYPQPYPQPATKPSQPGAPKGQVQQSFITQPEPEKPTSAPKPPQPSRHANPQGQVYQPFPPFHYPFYAQPEPDNKPASGPTAAPQPQQPEDPKSQVNSQFHQFPLYPHPETGKHLEKPTGSGKPQQPEDPQGKGHQQFNPYHYIYSRPGSKKPPAVKPSQAPQPAAPQGKVYPKQEPEKQPATKPSQPEAPKGQVHYQFPPQPEPYGPQAAQKPKQPIVPQSQVYQSFYHPFFYPQPEPENPPATKPAQPPQAPESHMHQPEHQSPSAEKPTSASNPPPEAPQPQEYRPFNPYPYHHYGYPFYSQPEPTDQQSAVPKPTAPEGDTPTVHNPQQPQYPQFVTLPPVTSIKDPHQGSSSSSAPANPQPSKGGTDQPVYCPQSCPSGLSNCCIQIAFHQHLHHIIPAKETPLFYPGLPFLPSLVSSEFEQGMVSVPLLQKSTGTTLEASLAPTSAHASLQSLSSEKGKQQFHQPPGGSPDALKGGNPSKPTNQQPIPFVPYPVHPYWPYLPQHESQQKIPQSQLPAHYTMPSQPQALGKGQVNPMVQHPSTISKLVTTEQRPSDIKSSDSRAPTYPEVISDKHNRLLQYLLQNAQGRTDNNHSHSAHPQPLVRSLQEPEHQPMTNANSDPKSYVLLQHGPPGRESNGFNRSPLLSTDLIHDANHQSYKPQHSQSWTPSLEKLQKPEWFGEGLPNPFPGNVNYMPRFGDGSSSTRHFSAPIGPSFVPLPQDPSSSADHLKPKFPGFWNPMAPHTSGQRVPPHIRPEAFQQWSSAADQPAEGFGQPTQEEGGKKK
ncbi:protein piccolo-like [Notolabrus celidotus]|uniref:protein piccolo-like n=1 Tax=Notolabrus celidotus TaxID=1203425 RepID=UPI00148FD23A|nr:protein piccolo-like [Notolabrus celidotus]